MGNGIITGNKNEITRETLATIRQFIIGNVAFVNSRDGLNFEAIADGDTVIVGKGMLYVYGYAALSKETETFKFMRANTEQYWFIYAEVDLSRYPNILTIKKVNNGRSTERTFRQDMLFFEKSGVYQRPLWRVRVTSNGIESIEDVRLLGGYKFEHGEWTSITSILIPSEVYSKYTFNSLTGELSFDESDKINKSDMVSGDMYYHSSASNRLTAYYKLLYPLRHFGRVSYIVESEGSPENDAVINKVDYAGEAQILGGLDCKINNGVRAETPPTSDSSGKVATTAFVHNVIDNI